MRVYLDNCCYNRPFDDQTQVKPQWTRNASQVSFLFSRI